MLGIIGWQILNFISDMMLAGATGGLMGEYQSMEGDQSIEGAGGFVRYVLYTQKKASFV